MCWSRTVAALNCGADSISIFYIYSAVESRSFKYSHFSEKREYLLIYLVKVRVYGTWIILGLYVKLALL